MNILILSRKENIHADMVEMYCKKYARVERINFDFENYDLRSLPRVVCGNNVFSSFDAFFIHHPRVSCEDEWFTDEIEKKLFIASWNSVKEWMEAQFSNAKWVNRPSSNSLNKNVLRQLRVASECGFLVPETLFTNQIDELRKFASSDKIIIKQGNLGVHIEGKRILTSKINLSVISEDMLGGCPCLFQKYIEKSFELRIHVIGSDVLACKIDSQVCKKTKIDWRNYDLDNTPHNPYILSGNIKNKCVTLVKKLGLSFGIIDMIVTPSGEFVFLECNSQGHWAWIEKMTGLPITKSLCDFIISHNSE